MDISGLFVEIRQLFKQFQKIDLDIKHYVSRKVSKDNEYHKLSSEFHLDNLVNSEIYDNISELINQNNGVPRLEPIFKFYQLVQFPVQSMHMWITVEEKTASQSNKYDSADMSDTFNMETMDIFNQITIDFAKIYKKFVSVDEMLTDYFCKVLVNDKVDIALLESIFVGFSNIYEFYMKLVQTYIDHCFKHDKKTMFELLELIEWNKNYILSLDIGTTAINHKSKNEPSVNRFGFIPTTALMNISNLLSVLYQKPIKVKSNVIDGVGSAENKIKQLESSLKSFAETFIVIFSISSTVIDYNSIKLLNVDIDQKKGVDSKIIADFDVVREIDTEMSKKSTMQFYYHIINRKYNESSKFYVIETLDYCNYRCLTPWKTFGGNYAVTYNKVKYLLSYIESTVESPTKSTNRYSPHNRAQLYHAQCIQASTQNMFLTRRIDLEEEMQTVNSKVDLHIIRNNIYQKIANYIGFIVEKSKIQNNVDVNNIIHNSGLRILFIDTLLKNYKMQYKDLNLNVAQTAKNEILLSYVSDLEDISRKFMKGLHDQYNRKLPDASVFSGDVKPKIIKIIEEIVNVVIMQLIGDKNVYAIVNLKNLLLNSH